MYSGNERPGKDDSDDVRAFEGILAEGIRAARSSTKPKMLDVHMSHRMPGSVREKGNELGNKLRLLCLPFSYYER